MLLGARALGTVTTNGPATITQILTNALTGNRYVQCTLGTNGVVEVVPMAPDLVRVRYHFAGLYDREEPAIAKPFSNWPAFSLAITNLGGTNLALTTSSLRVDIVLSNKFQIHFKDVSGYDLLRDFQIEYDPGYHQISDTNAYAQVAWPSGSTSVSNTPGGFKLKAIKVMPPNEVYFGGGEFATALNRRGATLQYWSQGTFAWEESRNPMYLSLPFWYGVQPSATNHPAFAYGVFFNNPARPVVKFNSGYGDTYSFEAGDDQLDYFFFGGGASHAPSAILDRYSELTGRPAMLPKWAYGFHQSRHSYGSQSNVLAIAQSLRDNDFPSDAIYLDIGVQNTNQQLTFNSQFTNVAGMVVACSNLGFRLVPLVEPFLLTNDPMYAEAAAGLYFLKNNDLSIHGHTNFLGSGLSWFDFSIAQTRDWWTARLTNFLSQFGFQAIWNDLNEPEENNMPLNVVWYLDGRYGGGTNNTDTRKWQAVNKNTYSLLEASVSYSAQRAANLAGRPFVLSRAGWPGIARYALGWSGDNVASYDHLRHNIRLGASVMISGQPNFGHDIGGFDGNVSDDLFTRWLAMGVLQPFFRNHTFSANREPWLFADENVAINRRIIKFRYEIMPYLYSLAHDTATNGMPLNRPTFFEFISDVNTYSLNDYDFLVGANLLAAPAYASNSLVRSVYLPYGANWFSWRYGDFYLGGQTVTEPAPVGALPLFVREGTIIPMGPVAPSTGAPPPDHLDLHVWPQASGDFTLYEDDGATTNYLAGAFAATRLTSAPSGNTLTLTALARQGSFAPGARSFYWVVHALSNTAAVALDGAPLPRRANRAELETAGEGWCFNFPRRELTIRVVDTAATRNAQVNFGSPYPVSYSSFSGALTNLTVAGSFNAWDAASRNMRKVTNFVWATVLDFGGETNPTFRFVANDGATGAAWGDNAQTNFSLPMQSIAAAAGSNILVSGAFTGAVSITFNETNFAYTVRPAGASDVDGDGLPDAWEFQYGFDPLTANDASYDADGDGLSNSAEYLLGANPVRSDSDGDSQSDGEEALAGTDPLNALSFFAVAAHWVNATNGSAMIRWNAVTGRLYGVEFAPSLSPTSLWSGLAGQSNLSGSGVLTAADTNSAGARFYRVHVIRP